MNELLISHFSAIFVDGYWSGLNGTSLVLSRRYLWTSRRDWMRSCSSDSEFCLVRGISEVTGDWKGFSCLKWHSVPPLKYPTAALPLTATFRVEISCWSCQVCHSDFLKHLKWHKPLTLKQLNPDFWVWEKSVTYMYSFYLLLITQWFQPSSSHSIYTFALKFTALWGFFYFWLCTISEINLGLSSRLSITK